MATLPVFEGGQIMLRGAQGGVPMVQVSPGQVEPLAARAAAQQSGTLAQILDRMSTSAFQEAGRLAPLEAMQFAADNPITPEQIEMAKNGLPMDAGLQGSIFGQALRKARSFELASHFEMEGKNELVKMLADVKAGKVNGEEISQRISTISNGYSKALASADPEAALKFRATMATHGNTVLNAAYEEQLKREQSIRRIKIDQYMDNTQRLMFAEAMQDPDTFLQRAEVHRKNVTDAAMLLGDVAVQREYSTKIQQAIMGAQVNAITTKLMEDDRYFQDTTRTISALRSGAMLFDDKFTPMMNAIKTLDPAATNEIIKNFRAEVSARIAKRDDDAKIDKQNRENEAQNLMATYFDPATPANQKRDLAQAIVRTRTLSVEQVEKFLDPQQRPGSKYDQATLETAIDNGTIVDFDVLLRQSNIAGLNGQQFLDLNRRLINRTEKDQTEAQRFIRQSAGVPDVQSVFASKDDQFKIDKKEAIEKIYNTLLDDWRLKNPALKQAPYRDLSRQAVDQYNQTDRADANKSRSRKAIEDAVADLKKEKRLPPEVTIDENTNLDDLLKRYGKLRPDDIDYLQRHQRTLRGVSR
jgi:predicted DCC family thiol-disulfide oxidoreductase YuxK